MNEYQYWANDPEEAAVPMDRRGFLKTTGTGIFLFFKIRDISFFTQEGPGRVAQQNVPSDFNAYLKIGEDGRVACYTGKIEMGQGIVTSWRRCSPTRWMFISTTSTWSWATPISVRGTGGRLAR